MNMQDIWAKSDIFWQNAAEYFKNTISSISRSDVRGAADTAVSGVSVFLFIIIGFCIYVLVYTLQKHGQSLKEAKNAWDALREKHSFDQAIDVSIAQNQKHETWEKIRILAGSENPENWKLAILDADSLLDKVLIEKGVAGESLGERLKNSQFKNTQNAWDAHKVRNRIAHDGSQFTLSRPIARAAIANYEDVFRELGVI